MTWYFGGKRQNLLWLELMTDATFFDVADVSFFSKWWFFYYRNGLWNLLNWRIIGILVLGLPVQFNWISKKI